MTNPLAPAHPVERAIRALGNATLAGLVTGVLVGGVGGRIVMRISAIAAEGTIAADEHGLFPAGLFTENGNRVGDITVGGTLALIIFGGAFAGLVGGIVLFAARPWLPQNLARRSLLFAAVLPMTAATTVITSENLDFRVLDPPELNIAMFAGLFAVFGAVVVLVEAALDRRLPAPPLSAGAAGAIYFGALLPATLAS